MPRSHILASVYDVPVADRKTKPLTELMTIASQNAASTNKIEPPAQEGDGRGGRFRIWDLHTSLHCSIIGCAFRTRARPLAINRWPSAAT